MEKFNLLTATVKIIILLTHGISSNKQLTKVKGFASIKKRSIN